MDVPAGSSREVRFTLSGTVKLKSGWYEVQIGHQATIRPDVLHVSVTVPAGWRISRAPGMRLDYDGRASAVLRPEAATTLRVHIVRQAGAWNLWDKLKNG